MLASIVSWMLLVHENINARFYSSAERGIGPRRRQQPRFDRSANWISFNSARQFQQDEMLQRYPSCARHRMVYINQGQPC
jgi:hypothetical protein